MRPAARSISPHCGGESEIEGLGERKPPKLQISPVRGSVSLALDRSLTTVLQLRKDMPADIVETLQYLVVPETQGAKAIDAEKGVAVDVTGAFAVLPTVDLDDQPCIEADEIKDVAVKRHLSPELGAGELAVAEGTPEYGFGRGGVGAHLARPSSDSGFRLLAHRTGP
jgi:hypothetical protein